MRLSTQAALRYARSGRTLWSVWGHAHQNRFVVPRTERIEVYVRRQFFNGVRRHRGLSCGQFGHPLNGSLKDSYFTSRRQAEKLAQEIRDGHHPSAVWSMREDADAFDLLDEELGLCDRGLGVYEEVAAARKNELTYEHW